MKWTKTKLYWRNNQYDATIVGPCEEGWYRCWVRRSYNICDSLQEAKAWAESVALPNAMITQPGPSATSANSAKHRA